MSKDYFNQVAVDWDSMRQDFFSENIRRQAIRAAGDHSSGIVVDLGCGTGFMTQALIEQAAEVYALDESEEMLALVQNKFGDKPNLQCLRVDGHRLPLPSASIDAVFANMYLHHIEDPLIEIKEIHRILKPGGGIYITDLMQHDFEFLRTEQHDKWLGFKKEQLIEWYEKAGFATIEHRLINEQCCSESNCSAQSAQIDVFLAQALKRGN